MTSSLIDELNKSADEWNSSNMFELARMCRKAADTISELQGALQVASVDYRHLSDELSAAKHDLSIFSGRIVELDAENARLRRELDSVGTATYLYGRSDLSTENAKLREIIADLEELLPESERWYSHETVKAIANDNAKLRELVREVFYKLLNVAGGRRELTAGEAQRTMDRMHELGVEL